MIRQRCLVEASAIKPDPDRPSPARSHAPRARTSRAVVQAAVPYRFVIERMELAETARQVAQVLHALPGREHGIAARRQRLHDADEEAQPAEAARPPQPEGPAGYRRHRGGEETCRHHVAGDPEEARRRLVEGNRGGVARHVVLGRDVEGLVGAAPVEDLPGPVQDDGRLAGQQVGERAVEDRGRSDGGPVEPSLEGTSQVQVAVTARTGLCEVETEIRGHEALHARRDGRVEKPTLRAHDDGLQAVQRRHEAGSTSAGFDQRRLVVVVDRDRGDAERRQRLSLRGRCAGPHERAHIRAAPDQGLGDAIPEIAACTGKDDRLRGVGSLFHDGWLLRPPWQPPFGRPGHRDATASGPGARRPAPMGADLVPAPRGGASSATAPVR